MGTKLQLPLSFWWWHTWWPKGGSGRDPGGNRKWRTDRTQRAPQVLLHCGPDASGGTQGQRSLQPQGFGTHLMSTSVAWWRSRGCKLKFIRKNAEHPQRIKGRRHPARSPAVGRRRQHQRWRQRPVNLSARQRQAQPSFQTLFKLHVQHFLWRGRGF